MMKSSSSSRARGWRGRRESDSQVTCHPKKLHARVTVSPETSSLNHVRTTTTTTTDGVNIPVVAQRQFPVVLRTIEIPQLHVDMVFDVPVVQVVRVPQVPSWRRQSCSHSCACLGTRFLVLFLAVRS